MEKKEKADENENENETELESIDENCIATWIRLCALTFDVT